MAALLACGIASAQSNVQLYGTIDTGVAHGKGSVSDRTSLINSGTNSSMLGFRGVEDMGGGLFAGFWAEAGVNTDSGAGQGTNTNNQNSGVAAALAGGQGLTFNRRMTVSLGGNWGELRLGRDYTPQWSNHSHSDPFGTQGIGTNQAANSMVTFAQGGTSGVSVRASNSIGYLYNYAANGGPSQGFNIRAMYYLGENPSNTPTEKDGTGWGVRAGYNAGPLEVFLSTSRTKFAAGDSEQTSISGFYDFNVVKLSAQWNADKQGPVKGKGGLIGAMVPVGPWQFKFAVSTYKADSPGNPKSTKFAAGYVYNFSKRTAWYGTIAQIKNSGSATQALAGSVTAAGDNSRALETGIRHHF